ncbi:MAG TPA: glycosyltransferase [Chloroflexota bacterium]|nr:glycosyltransferase [Chloroflexota bacterium]
MPEISIIIPARDEERYVRRALASVVAQIWPLDQLEVLVVDNGSVDATAEVARSYGAAHPALSMRLLSEPVAGVARAKNRGAREAQGRLFIFIDADSRMAPNLARSVVGWGRRGYGAGSIPVLADSSDLLDRGFFALLEFGKRLFNLQAQMFFCSRQAYSRIGGFAEELRLAEDSDFLARVRDAGFPLCRVRGSWIATSPRRLRARPWRLNMFAMLFRWMLASWGIGRRRPY